jgi:hypothetical protein
MRRYWRERRPTSMFQGAERMRLMTGILMLAVLYMLYSWAREANSWRWFAKLDGESVAVARSGDPVPAPIPAAALPPATGATDEDPDQAEEVRQEFQAVTDGTLTLTPEEMEPYDRLVFWAANQSFERLLRRSKSNLLFTHFHDEPNKYRGQLATLELNVRRILDAGKNRDGTQLYEVWGFTKESRDRLYVAIVVDLPKGMPIGPAVYEKAQFAGYFFKLQGFHAAGVKPGTVPDKSPLLIGRLDWKPTVAATPPIDTAQEWIWGLSALAAVGVVLLVWFIGVKLRPKTVVRPAIRDAASGEVIPIETWLEQAGFDENATADSSGGLDGGERESR